jgi:hypothetical protein
MVTESSLPLLSVPKMLACQCGGRVEIFPGETAIREIQRCMECGREISQLTMEGKKIIDYLRSLQDNTSRQANHLADEISRRHIEQALRDIETLESWYSIPSPH